MEKITISIYSHTVEQWNLPAVELSNLIFFFAKYRSEIRFAISAKRSEKQAHLEYKAFAVGWFIGADRRPETKSLFIPQCFENFKAFWRKETFCTENFKKLSQFGLSCSFVKVGGPR